MTRMTMAHAGIDAPFPDEGRLPFMDPIEPGWLGLGSLSPHPAFPEPKPPLEDVGVEDETIDVMEVMIEVMLVDDMSSMGDMHISLGGLRFR
jgi:hypothetical protein